MKRLDTKQLEWYQGDLTVQDHELKNFIQSQGYTNIRYEGDSSYVESIIKNNDNQSKFCVYIVNSPFKFSEIINKANLLLRENSFLYISINKFLAIPEPKISANEDYDIAIHNYIIENIHYKLIGYYSGAIDAGQKFNWIHPLTRFYFYNENIV